MPAMIQKKPPRFRLRTLLALLATASLALSGCTVAAYKQTGASRAGMQFSDSPHLAGCSSLLASIEPGTEDRGGASAAGCTVCR